MNFINALKDAIAFNSFGLNWWQLLLLYSGEIGIVLAVFHYRYRLGRLFEWENQNNDNNTSSSNFLNSIKYNFNKYWHIRGIINKINNKTNTYIVDQCKKDSRNNFHNPSISHSSITKEENPSGLVPF